MDNAVSSTSSISQSPSSGRSEPTATAGRRPEPGSTVEAHRLRKARVGRDALLRRLLAVADLVSLLVGVTALSVWGTSARQALVMVALAPCWLVLAKLGGLYDRDQRALRHLTVDEAPNLFIWAFAVVVGTVLATEAMPVARLTFPEAIRLMAVLLVSALAFRAGARWLWRRVTPGERTVIVGNGPLAVATRRKLELFRDIHVQLTATDEQVDVERLCHEPALVDRFDRVILASETIDGTSLRTLMALCRRNHVKLSVIPPLSGMFGTAAELSYVADLPVIEYTCWDISRSTVLLKRMLDVTASALAIVVLAPLLAVVALAIKLDSKGPVIFRQWRSGLAGEPFRIVKFRTMVWNAESLLDGLISLDDLEEPMFKLERDPRVTRVGRVLRRTSIDELPQLVNVLLGHMSLVGPRPEQVELAERYEPEYRFRFDVKPGITGPMQVYGRGELSFEERLAVEREYVENMSFSRDLRLLALTLPTVLSGRGAF